MPRGDRTGPMGMGPMTGRGAGYCAGYGVPGYMNPVMGRGMGAGFGRGGGRGWRNQYYATGLPGWMRYGVPGVNVAAPVQPEVEKQFLQNQVQSLQDQLQQMQKRLQELDAAKNESD